MNESIYVSIPIEHYVILKGIVSKDIVDRDDFLEIDRILKMTNKIKDGYLSTSIARIRCIQSKDRIEVILLNEFDESEKLTVSVDFVFKA